MQLKMKHIPASFDLSLCSYYRGLALLAAAKSNCFAVAKNKEAVDSFYFYVFSKESCSLQHQTTPTIFC